MVELVEERTWAAEIVIKDPNWSEEKKICLKEVKGDVAKDAILHFLCNFHTPGEKDQLFTLSKSNRDVTCTLTDFYEDRKVENRFVGKVLSFGMVSLNDGRQLPRFEMRVMEVLS